MSPTQISVTLFFTVMCQVLQQTNLTTVTGHSKKLKNYEYNSLQDFVAVASPFQTSTLFPWTRVIFFSSSCFNLMLWVILCSHMMRFNSSQIISLAELCRVCLLRERERERANMSMDGS